MKLLAGRTKRRFSAVLNTSQSTAQIWEVAYKKPSGPSLKQLNRIERRGLEAVP